jgi:glycosyltransferase involved in cell wall biosynthesis
MLRTANITTIFEVQQQNSLLTQKVSVVIPAYNEEKRIANTIKDLETNMPGVFEILVIFDGNDETPSVAQKAGEKVKVIRYSKRLGQGGAVLEGIKQASGSVICFIDADGASPWYEVMKVCSLVDNDSPVVYGSRWVNGAQILRKEPLRNIIGGRVYHYLAFVILGVKEKDSFCGVKAFRRDIALELVKRVTLTDRTFNISISYNLKLLGLNIKEVGIEWSHKDGTQLKVSLKVIVIMFLTLIGLRIAHSSRSKRIKRAVVDFRQKIHFY